MFRRNKGFTLIELLVVIAIIGVLASIVLVNLNAARNKAKAAAIKAALSGIRATAEMTYDDDGDYDAVCDGICLGSEQNLTQTAGTDFKRIADNITSNGGAAVCTEESGADACGSYAVWVQFSGVLAGITDWGWCVDSTGQSKKLTADPGSSITVCP